MSRQVIGITVAPAATEYHTAEAFGEILIHDHEACFYSYASNHQACMVHIECYLRDSIENENIREFEARYDVIVQTPAKELEDYPLCVISFFNIS